MPTTLTASGEPWWKEAVIYQIWPASYKDGNGDGWGDIPGIISTLDHVKSLGTTVIWLSPHYKSPQEDMGYDISDYEQVDPIYGTMDEMDTLIDEIHKRDMRLICDLVINHTSKEHKWFLDSRSSRDSPKRDWYIWRDPKYDENGNRQPPTNWKSYFSGSAWSWDEKTQQYYLRLFADGQPDLNWENPETREAIYNSAVKFWLDKGVDGFRIDTAGLYSKTYPIADATFDHAVDQPGSEFYFPNPGQTSNGPRIHEFHKEMYEKVTSNYDAMTVGEVGNASREDALKYVSAKEKEINMMFLFNVVELGSVNGDKFRYTSYSLFDFKKAIADQSDFIKGSDAWSTVFIENHDQPRSVTRFGNQSPEFREVSAKMLSTLQISLTGTLFLYQGQEIGMTNLPRSWDISEYKDISTINYWKDFVEKKNPTEEEKSKLLDIINLVARDHARSPVQWNDSEFAGFSKATPWTRVNDNYKEINVEKQTNDPNSVLGYWKKALEIRKKYTDVLTYGDFEHVDFDNQNVMSFVKNGKNRKAYVVLNFTQKEQPFKKGVEGELKLILSNVDKNDDAVLKPYESRIYLVE